MSTIHRMEFHLVHHAVKHVLVRSADFMRRSAAKSAVFTHPHSIYLQFGTDEPLIHTGYGFIAFWISHRIKLLCFLPFQIKKKTIDKMLKFVLLLVSLLVAVQASHRPFYPKISSKITVVYYCTDIMCIVDTDLKIQ